MRIDKQDHQAFLLEAFGKLQIPGQLIDIAFEVKSAVADADIGEDHRLKNALILLAKWPDVAAGRMNEQAAQEVMDATAALLEVK